MNLNESPLGFAKRITKQFLQQAKSKLPHARRKPNPISPFGKRNAGMLLEIVPTRQTTKIIGANWLAGYQRNDHSEHGEDGIISKIFERMPPTNKWVCEFGAHDPEIISNTWHLIHKQQWNAVLIEADDGYYAKLKTYYQANPNVHVLHTKVSYEGEEKLDVILPQTPIPTDMDLMVIDIDGNDYHVWEAIEQYRAKVLMIEFNASIPLDIAFTQPRNLNLSQGSSLRAMTQLAAKKGYQLIAVTSWNAFFVQAQYYHLFFKDEPLLEDMYVFPARHPIYMRAFQLYDGTMMMAPWNQMLWHSINLRPEDYQVLPTSLRFFSRELAARDYVMEKDGSKTKLAQEEAPALERILTMPGNVLGAYAKNNFSRYGEDGMLDKLIELMSIESCYVVDVGAGDGVTHTRSKHLSVNHAWPGLLLEDDPALLARLKSNRQNGQTNIDGQGYALEGERSLDAIFATNGLPVNIGALIINTFGMEYYLWESLTVYTPEIVMIQFNPTIPNDVKFVQAADSTLHQGCSLRALAELANYKGYELIATTLDTAFFIKRSKVYRLFETIGFKYAELDELYAPLQMQWFQLYDGTLVAGGLNRLLWHGLRIDEEKLQVVPKALRTFHQYASADYKHFFYRV